MATSSVAVQEPDRQRYNRYSRRDKHRQRPFACKYSAALETGTNINKTSDKIFLTVIDRA
jgi:hypothetical protein